MRMYAVFSSVSLRSLSVSRFVSFTNSCKGISRRVSRLHFGHVRLRLRVFCFWMPKYQQAIPRMAGHTGTSQHSPSRVRTVKGFRVASKVRVASGPFVFGRHPVYRRFPYKPVYKYQHQGKYDKDQGRGGTPELFLSMLPVVLPDSYFRTELPPPP